MEQEERITGFAPSITTIVSSAAIDAKELLISELNLAKLEFQQGLFKAKAAAITIAIGVACGFLGAIGLLFMAAHLLAAYSDVPLWGSFGIVGGALGLFGILVAVSGAVKSRDVKLLPRSPGELRKDFGR